MDLLSVQYLVQCLDTENVCHHITKMDLPQREMKETIFTRHYQTVLQLLANNRVLNNRPPPINDEETLLSRRQKAIEAK